MVYCLTLSEGVHRSRLHMDLASWRKGRFARKALFRHGYVGLWEALVSMEMLGSLVHVYDREKAARSEMAKRLLVTCLLSVDTWRSRHHLMAGKPRRVEYAGVSPLWRTFFCYPLGMLIWSSLARDCSSADIRSGYSKKIPTYLDAPNYVVLTCT